MRRSSFDAGWLNNLWLTSRWSNLNTRFLCYRHTSHWLCLIVAWLCKRLDTLRRCFDTCLVDLMHTTGGQWSCCLNICVSKRGRRFRLNLFCLSLFRNRVVSSLTFIKLRLCNDSFRWLCNACFFLLSLVSNWCCFHITSCFCWRLLD